jgi:hypothetical protein
MDEASMPGAPPTAQSRADATCTVNAKDSKGMCMARADRFWQHTAFELFKPMSAKQKAVYDALQSTKYDGAGLQREDIKQQQQLATAKGPGRLLHRKIRTKSLKNCGIASRN